MSVELVLQGWVSIVPSEMYGKWKEKGWVSNSRCKQFFPESFNELHLKKKYRMVKGTDFLWVMKNCVKAYKQLGFTVEQEGILIYEPYFDKMKVEVGKWYDRVISYVEKWLMKNGFLHIQKGSFKTGFCVESNPNHEVVQKWDAPLADEGNKVTQVKEKFGSIRVYFTNLTEAENKKVKEFEKHLMKKFDCVAYLG